MKRASCLVVAWVVAAGGAHAAGGPPLAGVWNIAPTGSAGTSGELLFRVTPGDGSDPVEITVPVMMGARQEAIARAIRNALSSQLGRNRYQVQLGEGGNVMVSDPRGQPNFSLELLDSDIDNLRVAVQSVTPSAPPTVPPQTNPAQPPSNSPPNTVPGNASAPLPNPTPVPQPAAPAPNPNAPVPNPSVPLPNPSPPPNATPGSPPGTTTPPSNTTPGTPPGTSAPPPASSAPAPGAAAPPPASSAPAGGAAAPPPG
jgi:hypothetical protein